MEKKLIYLACPYSHPNKFIRKQRFEMVTKYLAQLLEEGKNVFSPITMSHPAVKYLSSEDSISHKQWLDFDFAYLDCAKEMYVYMLEGWSESKGVLEEIEYALDNNIPIRWIVPGE